MAKNWGGKSYDEDWNEIDAMGNHIGSGKDWAANAGYAAANGTQNPYTNQAGSSPWDKSGLIPGNEPGSTLGKVGAGSGTNSAFGQKIYDKILSDITASGTVDQNDPAYRQQVDANRYAGARQESRQRAAMAQRMAAQGTAAGGGLDSAVQRLGSERGAQEQGFEGQLLNTFRQQNLDKAARALQLGTGLLSQEQEQTLRAALTREGYGLQRELGWGDINYRRDALGQQFALSKAQLDQQALLALLGG